MTIPDELRYHAEATVTRWLERTGTPPARIPARDLADGGWKRHARCGQDQPGAPDPELFFPADADDPATYRAQTLCAQCPVRQWCRIEASRTKAPGVWAGIWRDDRGRVAPLCVTPGCVRYRTKGQPECSRCNLAADRRAKRQRRRNDRLRAERAARREAADQVTDEPSELEVVAA